MSESSDILDLGEASLHTDMAPQPCGEGLASGMGLPGSKSCFCPLMAEWP